MKPRTRNQLLATVAIFVQWYAPAGAQVVRLLPALNLRQSEAEEGLSIIEMAAAKLAGN
jgi:acetylornithine/succinyldiaminopimelate/putrescine aminotransferase